MKLARGVVAEAEARAAAAVGSRPVPVLGRRVDARQPGPGAGRGPAGRPGRRGAHAAPLDAPRPGAGGPRTGLAAAGGRRHPRAPDRGHGLGPRGGARPRRPTPRPSSSATRPTSARSATWAAWPRWRTGTASRSSSTPRGARTSGSTPRCRRTRSPPAPTRSSPAPTRRCPPGRRAPSCWPAAAGIGRARLRRRRRGDGHDQPVGRDPRQHRCRPGPARARRRGAARPGHRCRGDGARAARPGARAGRARRPRGRPDPAHPGAARHRRRRQRGRGRPAGPGDAGRDGRPRHRRRDGDPGRHPARGWSTSPWRSWSRSTGTGGAPDRSVTSGVWAVDPVTVTSPREAFFAPRESVEVEQAVGRVSAELVAPYPPGIPVLAPGEEVTLDAVDACGRPGRPAAGSPTPPTRPCTRSTSSPSSPGSQVDGGHLRKCPAHETRPAPARAGAPPEWIGSVADTRACPAVPGE